MKKSFILLVLKYFFIGILAAGIELFIFDLLIKYYNYIFANSIAYAFGIIISFTINRFFNFKIKNKIILKNKGCPI